MQRKFLEDLGLTKEQIDSVMAVNGDDINKAKGELEDTKTKLEQAQGQVKTLTKDLETAKAGAGDNESLKKQLEDALQKQKDDTKQFESQMAELKLNNALKLSITDAQDLDMVIGQLDKSKISLDDKGKLQGLDEQIKSLKESKGFLFKQEQSNPSGFKPNQSNSGNNGAITKEQFRKMSYKERVNLFNTNKALYDQLKE